MHKQSLNRHKKKRLEFLLYYFLIINNFLREKKNKGNEKLKMRMLIFIISKNDLNQMKGIICSYIAIINKKQS
ncbi:hypothetical protein BHE86_13425 [Shigella sp. FC1655]|nr:hypothetical protein BGK50_14440 [Shigella sp. FC130]OEI95301.1 hypothetical protein BHE86_13425 [Shigella sp. FC1655]